MGCRIDIANINYVCDDIPTGGIIKFYLSILKFTHPIIENGIVTDINFDSFGYPVRVDFDYRDNYSNFKDFKQNNNGLEVNKPIIQLQIPLTTPALRTWLDRLVYFPNNLVGYVESAAEQMYMVGYPRGLTVTSIDGTSGASINALNNYKIEFTGEEKALSYNVTDIWDKIIINDNPDYSELDYNIDFNI